MKNRISDKIFKWGVFTFLIIYALTICYTLFFGVLTSFKSYLDVFNGNILGFPNLNSDDPFNSIDAVTKFSNYVNVFNHLDIVTNAVHYRNGVKVSTDIFGRSLSDIHTNIFGAALNTVIYCAITVLAKLFAMGISAYMVAKYKFKFSKVIYTVLLLAMTIPIVGTQASELEMLKNLGLYSTWIGCFFQSANFSGMYFFVFYAFFVNFSDTYVEAAEIDGASQLRSLITIVIPLTSKMFLSIGLILFVQSWNQYESVYLYMPTHPTLGFAIFDLVNQTSKGMTSLGAQCAACAILAIPTLILFLCFHKTLMGNVSLGGLKE